MSAEDTLPPVVINGVVLKPKNELHRHKLEALRGFMERLLASPAREHIAKVFLFGSALRGDVWEESDVDVLIFGMRPLASIEEACMDAAYETILGASESVEPLVRTVNNFLYPQSHFVYTVLREGKEVYSMDEEGLRRKDVEAMYTLATQYLGEARRRYEPHDEGSRRVTTDAAYNAIELCAKAMLRLKVEHLPKTHTGVVTLFSDHYIKTGDLPRHFGRAFTRALTYRNDARYDGDADITPAMVDEVLDFAEEMVSAFEAMLAGSGDS